VEAHAGNLRYPILFLAQEEGNLAREVSAQLAGGIRSQSEVFFGVFHVSDLYSPLLKIAVRLQSRH
jgi:hypothetical protein